MTQKITTIFTSLSKSFGATAGAIIVVLMILSAVYIKTAPASDAELDTASGIRKQVMLNDERIKTNAVGVDKNAKKIDKLSEIIASNTAHSASVEAKLDVLIELVKANRYNRFAVSDNY